MTYNFDRIAGYTAEKEELMRLCDVFNNRAKYQEKGAKLPKGIIFYGEAGTGKTLFAKVLSSVCELEILKISMEDVKDDGDVCKPIRKAFLKASKRKHPTMIFFDEVDKVLPNLSESYCTDRSKAILTQLLTFIDGMDSSGNVIFVATCNDYDSIPETLVRPGRIDKKIGIGLPNYSSRVEILDMYMKKSSCRFEISTTEIAKLCAGFSCAGLETLVNECVLQSDDNGFVSEELIRTRFFEIKNEDIPRGRSSVEDYINACYNVGAFVVAKAFNNGHYTLSLETNTVCNNFFDNVINLSGDDDDWDDDDDCEESEKDETSYDGLSTVFSKSDYLNTITVLYGGFVAEEIVLNKVYDNVDSAFNTIDSILLKMFKCAMFGIELRYVHSRHEYNLPYTSAFLDKVNAVYAETEKDCYTKAQNIIKNNVDLIKKLSNVLVEKQVIQEADCERLIDDFGGLKF